MGFFKEFFSNLDEPAFRIRIIRDAPKRTKADINPLIEENKRLREQLETKKVNAIDVDYKLLRGIQ